MTSHGDYVSPRLMERAQARERADRIRTLLLSEAEHLYAEAMANYGPHSRAAEIYAHAITKGLDNNFAPIRQLAQLKRVPVTIEEFIDSREFLGDLQTVWPKLREDILAMNPDVFTGADAVRQVLLGGATGTGKTTLSYSTLAYQAYLFDCFNKPQVMFGLSEITPIVFMMQSVSQSITKRIIYRPFRELFTSMPYAQKWMTWDNRRESELIFESGVTIVPALANLEAILGQAIAAGMLDEVNFMKVIEDSKQAVGSRGKGGTYDQATEVYSNIERRQQRSFQTRGFNIGTLCVLSSTRYKSDFLDRRMEEVRKHDLKGILCLRRKQYEVVPQERFCGDKFKIIVGSDEYRTRIIEDGEVPGTDYPAGASVEEIPVEYKARFVTDPDGALRDIVGIATDTISPFIQQRHKIVEAVIRFREQKLKPICRSDFHELSKLGMPQWDETVIDAMRPAVKAQPRFVHIDLSISGDACGVAVLRHAGFVNRPVKESPGKMEVVPHVIVEAAVGIKPSKTHELQISEVRRWVMQLQEFYGINIYKITYDGFQSVESKQVLIAAGVRCENVSMDRDMGPYNELKDALYENRIDIADLDFLRAELSTLEYHADKGKVDHPPKACFTGDTRIRLSNGGSVRFDEVAGQEGVNLVTFDGVPRPEFGWHPRVTMFTRRTVEVYLENGETVKCTPDHLFLLTDGSYKEAQHLTLEDDLQGC